jgi:hypothetical protein
MKETKIRPLVATRKNQSGIRDGKWREKESESDKPGVSKEMKGRNDNLFVVENRERKPDLTRNLIM